MPHVLPEKAASSPRQWPLALMLASSLVGILLAATIALWAYYGSAVFYEMLLSGIAACF